MGSDPATEDLNGLTGPLYRIPGGGWGDQGGLDLESDTWMGTQQDHGGLHIALYPSFCFFCFGTGFGGSTGFSLCYIWDSLLIIIILSAFFKPLLLPCCLG
ncbi:hypothetical protein LX32DRAFT_316582 [Colletotrichum zoysiae]|uniref:Uncharacterized protein n=1 Tax=Colletotrichum zoysiae TaxID=1216348 RepID=A0AAD9M3I4_9PEZI|nr:hypothetical protein LX32DRAFT_316582 [Colletotrichum zoysiae]